MSCKSRLGTRISESTWDGLGMDLLPSSPPLVYSREALGLPGSSKGIRVPPGGLGRRIREWGQGHLLITGGAAGSGAPSRTAR